MLKKILNKIDEFVQGRTRESGSLNSIPRGIFKQDNASLSVVQNFATYLTGKDLSRINEEDQIIAIKAAICLQNFLESHPTVAVKFAALSESDGIEFTRWYVKRLDEINRNTLEFSISKELYQSEESGEVLELYIGYFSQELENQVGDIL